MLAAKYRPPGHAIFHEVSNATGLDAAGYCDAMVLGLWPSLQYSITGFEIKVSRSDWLNEIRNPNKSERFMRYCDFWYLLISNKSMVEPGELPPTWGMMAPANGRLKVIVPALRLTAEPTSRALLMAIARRAMDCSLALDDKEIDRRVAAKSLARQYEVKQSQEDYNKLYDAVKEFEEKSGLTIHRGWDHPKEVGEAVKMVLSGLMSDGNIRSSAAILLNHIRNIRADTLRLVTTVNKLKRLRDTK
jgi:hypothetical protein